MFLNGDFDAARSTFGSNKRSSEGYFLVIFYFCCVVRFNAAARIDLRGYVEQAPTGAAERVKLNLFVNTGACHCVTQSRSGDWAVYYSKLAGGHACSITVDPLHAVMAVSLLSVFILPIQLLHKPSSHKAVTRHLKPAQ